MEFHHQVAIVTGAGQGIGFEIALQLAGAGAAVVLNDLDADLAERAAGRIAAHGGLCRAVAGDASEGAVVRQMTEVAVADFGQLTLAVANAGITLFGSFLEYRQADLQRVLDVNLRGSFLLAQEAARQMVRQRTGGSMLFISSVTGHQAYRNLVAYGMTKAGLEMLAKGLVAELSEHRITVNALAPGATLTERTCREEAGYEKNWSALTPMGRPAQVEDIARAALFLLSPKSRHITGQTLVVDGGWTARSPEPG